MDTPRQVTRLHTSGSGAALCRSWSPSSSLTQRMPSDRLIKAVLANISTWIDALTEVEQHTKEGQKSTVLHLKRNMIQSRISFLRLTGASEDEIEQATRQANREAEWPDK